MHLPSESIRALAKLSLLAGWAAGAWAGNVIDTTRIDPGRYGKITGNILSVTVPEKAAMTVNAGRLKLDLNPWRGQLIDFSIKAKATGVTKPPERYTGVKFMFQYRLPDGTSRNSSPSNLFGTFDWKTVRCGMVVDSDATDGALVLGLQNCYGTVEFDLSSLTVSGSFRKVNLDHRAVYSETVRNAPPLRGVMSSYRFPLAEDDFRTLQQWHANLIRLQLNCGEGYADLTRYDRWLDQKLAEVDAMLPLAQRYGIRVVIDLHSPPGGSEPRQQGRNLKMLADQRYADYFVKIWERIAARYRNRPEVWAYGLINEPIQRRTMKYDYWELQRRAAEAIRRIDPEKPIIVTSNLLSSPLTFDYLSPLKLKNIIYEVHMYDPFEFTHQGVGKTDKKTTVITYPGAEWNKAWLYRRLAKVRAFQLKHGARIYCGEFSAVVWAPGADQYLRDCIDIFEQYGWDWTYHAFREWNGWSVEHAGPDRDHLAPSSDNARKQALLRGLGNNQAKKNEGKP